MASVTRNPRPLFVTTLPAGSDGMEVFYQSTTAGTGGGSTNSMADVGAVWHLRYRAAASGSYKWEMVGGSALDVTSTSTPTAITATTPTSLSTNPILTLPNAGTYRLEVFSNGADVVYASGGAGRLAIGFSVGMTETASTASGAEIYTSAAELISPMFGSFVKDITGAGTLLTMKAWTSTGATFYPQVRTSVPYGIRATPIRVG